MILGSTVIAGAMILIGIYDVDGMILGIHHIMDGTILGIMVIEVGMVRGIRRGMVDITDGDTLMTIIGDGADIPAMFGEVFTEFIAGIPVH